MGGGRSEKFGISSHNEYFWRKLSFISVNMVENMYTVIVSPFGPILIKDSVFRLIKVMLPYYADFTLAMLAIN